MSTVARATVQRPLLAVVAVAVGLILARAAMPELKFDTTSLVLFAIAAAAWALAYLPISKFKAGEYEIELVQAVDTLKQKVSQIETADRVVGELEQQVIASEAAVAARATHVPAQWEGKVMRGDPATRMSDQERGSLLEDFQRITASSAPDGEKISRAVAAVERSGNGDPACASALEMLRRIDADVKSGRLETSSRLTGHVLDLAWRLIAPQTQPDERRF